MTSFFSGSKRQPPKHLVHILIEQAPKLLQFLANKMDEYAPTWKRPSSDFPKIWLRKNGFVIRDVSPDLDKFVVQHMVENFAQDAPMFKSMGLTTDPDSMADVIWLWRDLLLPQRVSLVALAENTPGADLQPVGDDNPPKVLGANVLSVSSRADKQPPILEMTKGAPFKRLITAMRTFTGSVDVFEQFGVDHALDATGLSVGRESRGLGLGQMLLEARLEMCRGIGIPITKTMFTAIPSQKLAARGGFKIVKETAFPELLDKDGNKFFKDLHHTLQLSVYKFN